MAISAGGYHTCGLRADGVAVCWGSDDSGQIAVPRWQRFDAIAAGAYHTCGLRVEGDAMCWGSGGGSVQFFAFERFEAISAGGNLTCGLSPDGRTACWSPGAFSESGPPQGVRFRAVGVGSGYACGLRGYGEAVCWADESGGHVELPPRSPPRAIQGRRPWDSSRQCGG